MKIGIAISGCGAGGALACYALKQLRNIGICPHYISCSLSGVAGLLAASCHQSSCVDAAAEYLRLCETKSQEEGITYLCGRELMSPYGAAPLICCVNKKTAQCKYFGFNVKPLDKICCAAAGLTPYKSSKGTLCDFASYFGSPLFPLKEAGADKVIALVYKPEDGAGPWTACRQKLVEITAANADIVLEFPHPKSKRLEDFIHECAQIAEKVVAENVDVFSFE